MNSEIGSCEAKTRLPGLLREVRKGKSFTITNRGEPVAELVPVRRATDQDAARAVEGMRAFMRSHRVTGFDIKALIEEGAIEPRTRQPRVDALVLRGWERDGPHVRRPRARLAAGRRGTDARRMAVQVANVVARAEARQRISSDTSTGFLAQLRSLRIGIDPATTGHARGNA